MYKHLYDNFAHWYKGGVREGTDKGSIWFYSDPHFSDPDLVKYRKDITDDEQVRRINSKVGKYDTLVILGDIGNLEYVKKLRGYKVLVMGNHDAGATNYQRKKILINNVYQCPLCNNDAVFSINIDNNDAWCYTCRKWVKPLEVKYSDNHLFDEVYEGALMISEKLILSHEPIENIPWALNLHGHVHSLKAKEDERHWNLCAEHINYTPVSINEIVSSGLLKNILTIHRATIDTATDRKQKRNK